MQLVDTHCHIHEADYPLDVDKVLARARVAGVTRLICVGTDEKTSAEAVTFAATHKNCWASVGLHPHEAKSGQMALETLRELAQTPGESKIVAIGECGLDYFYGHSTPHDQQQALRFQIELALAHDLPLIFHVRDAFDDFWPIFDSYSGLRGVLHSFTDTQENLDKAIERELYIGVNGITTFTKNEWQLAVAKRIPLENLLLETDAPFLTPTPLRGNINESAYVALVGNFLATLRSEPVETIAASSTQNAIKLFTLV